MKILKYLFFLLLIIFIAGAIYFATQDGTYDIKESKRIEAPVSLIFDKVNDYKTWENWGPWKQDDPTMVFNYPEKTSGEGASYSWNGKEADGSMRTTQVIPNQRIEQDITFITPGGEREAKVYWQFENTEKGTELTWGIRGEHTLTDKAYFTLTGYDFEADMRKMYRLGLDNLNQMILDDMKAYTVKVDGITQYSGGFYMYTTTSTTLENVNDKVAELLPQVYRFMEGNNITISGKPLSLYNAKDAATNSAIISAGIPTTSRIVVPEDSAILCGFMPAYTVVKTTLTGDLSNLEEAWSKTEAYLSQNNYTKAEGASVFQVYVKGAEEDLNPATWITELYIPIEVAEPETEQL